MNQLEESLTTDTPQEETTTLADKCVTCDREAEVGCHVVYHGEVLSASYCEECHLKIKKGER